MNETTKSTTKEITEIVELLKKLDSEQKKVAFGAIKGIAILAEAQETRKRA